MGSPRYRLAISLQNPSTAKSRPPLWGILLFIRLSRIPAIKKPEITKNTSTPRNSVEKPGTRKWTSTTAIKAIARSRLMSPPENQLRVQFRLNHRSQCVDVDYIVALKTSCAHGYRPLIQRKIDSQYSLNWNDD